MLVRISKRKDIFPTSSWNLLTYLHFIVESTKIEFEILLVKSNSFQKMTKSIFD